MHFGKWIAKQAAVVAIGQGLCTALMLGIFALLGRWNGSVLLGGIVGSLISILNYLAMAWGAEIAMRKAEAGNGDGAKSSLRLSWFLRLGALFGGLYLGLRAGCDPLALALPIAFLRPVLTVVELLRKKAAS